MLKHLSHERKKSEHETRQAFLRAENTMSMMEEIEQECLMKNVENFAEDETDDVPVPDVVKSDDLRVPGFLMCITQVIHYTKKDRDYVKCPRYPNEIVMIAIELMVHSDLAATRVPRAFSSAWTCCVF